MSHADVNNTLVIEDQQITEVLEDEVTPKADTTLATTNTFALVALILAFIQPIASIVFGHISLSQIKKNGDSGRGLALTGLIIGYIYTAMLILLVFAYVGFFVFWALALGSATGYDFYSDPYGW